jgi:Protein of unknown function (DUF1203)
MVRAYDRRGRIAHGVLAADGDHATAIIRELLASPDISLIQLRNVGCRSPAAHATTPARTP